MAGIRERLNVVVTIMEGRIPLLPEQLANELIFIQFRKSLEEIAFAFLSANRDKYSEVHGNFAKHWRAKAMLEVLDEINPNFYPVAVPAPIEVSPGYKHFGEPFTEGVLTRDDFVLLYNCASEALHTRNPYKSADRTINIKYPGPAWVNRFQKLLSWHITQLLSGERWVVNVPADGPVRAWSAV